MDPISLQVKTAIMRMRTANSLATVFKTLRSKDLELSGDLSIPDQVILDMNSGETPRSAGERKEG
jgi:hypothetical protein